MSLIDRITARITSLELEYKVHLIAFGIFALSIGQMWVLPDFGLTHKALTYISLFGFAVDFVIWCWPSLKCIWSNPLGKVAISLFHLLVLYIATVLARFVVASSLGLPPQDFDLTVTFTIAALYIPTWSFVVSLLLAIATLTLEIVGFGKMFLNHSFGSVAMVFARMTGAIVIFFVSKSVFQFAVENEKSLYSTVRWVAFFADFQPAPMYPGINAGERIRLHENGVISVASFKNGAMEVLVRQHAP